jgi:hypothetical protein
MCSEDAMQMLNLRIFEQFNDALSNYLQSIQIFITLQTLSHSQSNHPLI